jgi:hypothetical protein
VAIEREYRRPSEPGFRLELADAGVPE